MDELRNNSRDAEIMQQAFTDLQEGKITMQQLLEMIEPRKPRGLKANSLTINTSDMKKEELNQAGLEFLRNYDKKIMSPSHSISAFVLMLTDFVYYLTQRGIIRDKEEPVPLPRKDSYLLFGREVCDAMAEETIDEVLDLIRDGAEYSIIKTDGSNLSAILSQLEEYAGYCFLTEKEYNKILNIEL
jgi:hypothetical protein